MLSLLAAAVAPALALLFYFYLKDEFEQEPVHMVIRCFLFGAFLVLPVMFAQYIIGAETAWTTTLAGTAAVPALLEELFKWFTVMAAVYTHIHFNQRYDGIVYACAVGLGFASVENVFYLLEYGLDYAFIRAVFPVSGHALFAVVMGYYIGRAKFGGHRNLNLFLALLIPVLLHFSYNFLVISRDTAAFAAVPFMIGLWILAIWKVKKANRLQHSALHIS
ncbi:glutamic-type intramembrane protease PrsW [Alkalicoccus luteus]|uniref:glutamic-type intramembrane protease PrsW n=1 Tax=Alkalicoccus luteus TaxID=1237094 RepID=UPI004034381E